ncbi:MAG: lytic transglycosylase domain-containing protein [Gammaproteobacteria bacterium]|nr:lytic transglycosylase domain-containing protein [Gammaproteobacteria bacterium]
MRDTCISIINWNGFIEIFQEPLLSSSSGVVEFRVIDSKIYTEDGKSHGVLGTLWNWIKQYVHPRFNRLQLDLNPVLTELKEFLELLFPLNPDGIRQVLDSVSIGSVDAVDGRIELGIRIDVPEYTVNVAVVESELVLTEDELVRWEEAWQHWDAFLTLVIKHAGTDTDIHDLRSALLAVLLDARQDLLEVLVPSVPDAPDPVPGLFVKTWERLAPELRHVSETLPTTSALNYLSFITAADALMAIQTVEEETGFALTADALRHMARMIAPAYPHDPLHYDTVVDPELRALFGFGPPLPPPETDPAPAEPPDADQPVHLSLPPARSMQFTGGMYAAMVMSLMPVLIVRESTYRTLVDRLKDWVPTLKVLDEYLPLVRQMLDYVAQDTLQEKKLDAQFADLYHSLVLATAWQESCWRQYIKVKGEVKPIRSHAGAVGIMQVNQHIWRGFYDVNGLQHDVGYNAEAGSEILHHYLVDYALAKGEQNQTGGIDNLPRATYALYNGGPKHMTRYRREQASASLRAIDNAFWKKFQTMRSGNTLAVAECYTG